MLELVIAKIKATSFKINIYQNNPRINYTIIDVISKSRTFFDSIDKLVVTIVLKSLILMESILFS
jgi:hypothetical protein